MMNYLSVIAIALSFLLCEPAQTNAQARESLEEWLNARNNFDKQELLSYYKQSVKGDESYLEGRAGRDIRIRRFTGDFEIVEIIILDDDSLSCIIKSGLEEYWFDLKIA